MTSDERRHFNPYLVMNTKDRIRAYVLNQLPEIDKLALEKEISDNSKLRQQVTAMKGLVAVEELERRDHIRTQLKSINTTTPARSSNIKSISYYAVRVAAILLVGIVAWWAIPTPLSYEKVVVSAQNYSKSQNIMIVEAIIQLQGLAPSSVTEEDFKIRILKHLERGTEEDFKAAFEIMDDSGIPKINTATERENIFLWGIIYFYNKDYKNAINKLAYLDSSITAKEIQKQSQWFLALSYYQTNQYEKATDLIGTILNNPEQKNYHEHVIQLKQLIQSKK